MGLIVDYDESMSVEIRRESLTIHTESADVDYAPRDEFGHGHAELGFSTVAKFLRWLRQADEEGLLPPALEEAIDTFTDYHNKRRWEEVRPGKYQERF